MQNSRKILLLLIASLLFTACRPEPIEPPPLKKKTVSAEFITARQHLYALSENKVAVYDISNEDQPVLRSEFSVSVDMRDRVEKIRHDGDFLFLVGSYGAYIYDITQPSNPDYAGMVSSLNSCSSFLIKDTLAYSLLDTCSQGASSNINALNISTKNSPLLMYSVNQSFGSSIARQDSILLVSRGAEGIVFRSLKSNDSLSLLRSHPDFESSNIVPLGGNRFMVRNSTGLHQYTYDQNFDLVKISFIPLPKR